MSPISLAWKAGRLVVVVAGKLVYKSSRGESYVYQVSPLETAQVRADVVFIHGLGGDCEASWTAAENDFFLPLELSKDPEFSDVRFLSVDYPTSLHNLDSIRELPLEERAQNVRDKLRAAGVGTRPFVLVCHSMGGLLAKYVLADDWVHEASSRRFWPALRGIVFFATPHKGADIARMLTYYLSFMVGTEVAQLKKQDWGELDTLHGNFLAFVEQQRGKTEVPRLAAYYEQLAAPMAIVSRDSATNGIDVAARCGIPADHEKICKPLGHDDAAYFNLREFLVLALGSERSPSAAAVLPPERRLPRVDRTDIVPYVPPRRRWWLLGSILMITAIGLSMTVLFASGILPYKPESPTARSKSEDGLKDGSSDPRVGPPPRMSEVPGGSFFMGTTDKTAVVAACQSLDRAACMLINVDRELAHAGWRDVAEFLLDDTEVTTSDFAAWIHREFAAGRARLDHGHVRDADGRLLLTFDPKKSGWRPETLPFFAVDGEIRPSQGMAAQPATLMTWAAADAYCRDRGARLPSEVEWEFAARGPDSREYVWGDRSVTCREVPYGRYGDPGGPAAACPGLPRSPEPVGRSTVDVSWSGIHDMGANVSEWVADVGVDAAIGCQPPDGGKAVCHIFKGGSWADPILMSRPAAQSMFGREPDDVTATIGFRCAKDRRVER